MPAFALYQCLGCLGDSDVFLLCLPVFVHSGSDSCFDRHLSLLPFLPETSEHSDFLFLTICLHAIACGRHYGD